MQKVVRQKYLFIGYYKNYHISTTDDGFYLKTYISRDGEGFLLNEKTAMKSHSYW